MLICQPICGLELEGLHYRSYSVSYIAKGIQNISYADESHGCYYYYYYYCYCYCYCYYYYYCYYYQCCCIVES